jgi:hypothetical protein
MDKQVRLRPGDKIVTRGTPQGGYIPVPCFYEGTKKERERSIKSLPFLIATNS